MMGYRFAEHTGELELELRARDERGVFGAGFEAMRELLAPEEDAAAGAAGAPPAGVPAGADVALAGRDRAALLADWLAELAILAEIEGLVPERLERLELSGEGLTARVEGRRGMPPQLVKGATYHRLAFEPAGDGWFARWCSMSEPRRPAPASSASEPRRVGDVLWEIEAGARPDMRVPARVFCDAELLRAIGDDRSLEQLQNVATLPGIAEAAIAMPDIHQGYGFPVGAVAATEPPDGVVSPGGVGYDINCGVRLLTLPVDGDELGERREALVHRISREAPAGGRGEGPVPLRGRELERLLREGPRFLAEARGVGTGDDVERTESGGRLEGAEPASVSARAKERGAPQLGTVGSGNHFVEVQLVEEVHDPAAGLRPGQVTVLIHSGSRGLGHQVCTDFVKRMDAALGRHGIELADRQLSCAPLSSAEGREYMGAMAAAANFAWGNRQAIAHGVRAAVRAVLGDAAARDTRQVYDVAHNVARLEDHGDRRVCVHRKGATRALPGQLAFIPGSMGTASYVLVGRPGAMELSFGTVCHGAGRRMSRTGARKRVQGAELRRQLEEAGITVRCPSNRGLAEEAPFAYKEVERVVEVVERAGLAARVARLRPIGIVKG